MDVVPLTNKDFFDDLLVFVQSIGSICPDNTGVQQAIMGLQIFNDAQYHPMMCKMWADLATPIVDDIKARRSGPVGAAFDGCSVSVIANIGVSSILTSTEIPDDVKSRVWDSINQLTATAFAVQFPGSVRPQVAAPPAPVPVAAAPVPAPAAPQPAGATGAARPAAPPIKEIIKGISTSLPDIISGLNDVLKTNGMEGENPVMDMVKQMMNPGAVQSGAAPNLMALATGQGQQPPAMSEAAASMGMTAEEIQAKLARLDNFEKARERRRKGRD